MSGKHIRALVKFKTWADSCGVTAPLLIKFDEFYLLFFSFNKAQSVALISRAHQLIGRYQAVIGKSIFLVPLVYYRAAFPRITQDKEAARREEE